MAVRSKRSAKTSAGLENKHPAPMELDVHFTSTFVTPVGFEPTTQCLKGTCATTALRGQVDPLVVGYTMYITFPMSGWENYT